MAHSRPWSRSKNTHPRSRTCRAGAARRRHPPRAERTAGPRRARPGRRLRPRVFGKAEWLQPYTDKTLEELARQGIKNVQVICPGFPADCLETLEEIAQEGKESFIVAGGKSFHYIPALNESPLWIDALGNLALANLGGWLNPELDPDSQKQALDDAARRARAMGAKA